MMAPCFGNVQEASMQSLYHGESATERSVEARITE
jgi:hypothetical protein